MSTCTGRVGARTFLVAIAASALLASGGAHAAPASAGMAPIPIKDFARRGAISQPRLSPDGTHLSVDIASHNGESHTLVIYNVADMKVYSTLRLPKYELPLDTIWVSNDRLVIEKGYLRGALGKPLSMGEIITTDINGKHQDYLFGPKPYGRRSLVRGTDRGWGFISGAPQPHDGDFWMRATPWVGSDRRSMLYAVTAHSSARHLIGDIGVPGLDFTTDRQGKVRYAFGTTPQMKFVAYRKQDGDWNKLSAKVLGTEWDPIAFTADNGKVLASWSKDGGPEVLGRFDLDGQLDKIVMSSDAGNIGYLQWTAPPSRPFAAAPVTGLPRPQVFDANAPEAKLYLALMHAFPGQFVDFINYSDDGRELLFSTASDRNPGTYYLIDRSTNKVRKLFDVASWLPRQRLAQRQVAHFTTSDGKRMEAILTVPAHRSPFKLPMVLLPHGGPMAHDTWFYDNDAQLLASRGYLVLQVNFRGSDGRGPSFYQAGYRHWGTRIQQDLIDSVHWAIKEAYADPKRICVYGASFGGYSALMSVIRAPKLFKCAIGYAGVYDLKMQLSKSDTHETEYGRTYLETALGHDPAVLAANSPVDLAAKVQVPVLLIHGTDDKRAPYDGAVEMRDALKQAGKSVQWMAKDHEGHGFYDTQNNIDLDNAVLAFLKKNIGPGAPVKDAPANGQASTTP